MLSQRLRLIHRAREAVEQEPVGGVGLGHARLHHVVGDLAGNQVACVEVLLGLEPSGVSCPMLARNRSSGGDVRNAELLGQDRGLGALPAPGGPRRTSLT